MSKILEKILSETYSLHISVFSTCLEMRKTNTPIAALKDCLFLDVWMNVCTDLLTSYAEKLGHNCSEEWSVNPMGAAHISMRNSFNFPLARQKLFPEKSSESDHLLLFFAVVSRSRTLQDRLWPLGMGLPEYSTAHSISGESQKALLFSSASSTMIFLHLSSMSSFFWVSRVWGKPKKMASVDITLFHWGPYKTKIPNATFTLYTPKCKKMSI